MSHGEYSPYDEYRAATGRGDPCNEQRHESSRGYRGRGGYRGSRGSESNGSYRGRRRGSSRYDRQYDDRRSSNYGSSPFDSRDTREELQDGRYHEYRTRDYPRYAMHEDTRDSKKDSQRDLYIRDGGFSSEDRVNTDSREKPREFEQARRSGESTPWAERAADEKEKHNFHGQRMGSYGYRHERNSNYTPHNHDEVPSNGDKHMRSSTVSTFTNPWVSLLSIKDGKTMSRLEENYKSLTELNDKIASLQCDKVKLTCALSMLEVYSARDALNVELCTEKLNNFSYL